MQPVPKTVQVSVASILDRLKHFWDLHDGIIHQLGAGWSGKEITGE